MSIHWRSLDDDSDGSIEWRDLVETDLYEVLEVSRNASAEVIKRAYRTLVEKYHPDRHSAARKSWAEEMTKQLNAAYATLGNPERRARYDREKGYLR